MNKKLIIGSLLAVCIMMMLPSVSAIEFGTIQEKNKIDVQESNQDIDIAQITNKIKDMNGWDSPLLTQFVKLVLKSQFNRFHYLQYLSGENYPNLPTHPFVYMVAMSLLLRMYVWSTFWHSLGINVALD